MDNIDNVPLIATMQGMANHRDIMLFSGELKFSRRKPHQQKVPRIHAPRVYLNAAGAAGSKRFSMSSMQRAIVKAHYAPSITLSKHLSYLQMDGKGLDGKKPEVFTEKGKEPEIGEIKGEERIFKIVLSPENGLSTDGRRKLEMRQLTRDFMTRFQADYALSNQSPTVDRDDPANDSRKLRWFAAAHYNTSNPHSHIVLRGLDTKGREVKLEHNLIAIKARQIAQELVTQRLGQRSRLEIESQLSREITSERFTQIDRAIATKLEIYSRAVPVNHIQKDRLEYLEHHMHLARKIGGNTYQLDPHWKKILERNSRKDDIIKTLYHDLSPEMREQFVSQQSTQRLLIYNTDWYVKGKVVAAGISDELRDKPYVLLESRGHLYFYTSTKLNLADLKIGSTLTLDKGKVAGAPEIQMKKGPDKSTGQGRELKRSL